jgi:hypothetical protein
MERIGAACSASPVAAAVMPSPSRSEAMPQGSSKATARPSAARRDYRRGGRPRSSGDSGVATGIRLRGRRPSTHVSRGERIGRDRICQRGREAFAVGARAGLRARLGNACGQLRGKGADHDGRDDPRERQVQLCQALAVLTHAGTARAALSQDAGITGRALAAIVAGRATPQPRTLHRLEQAAQAQLAARARQLGVPQPTLARYLTAGLPDRPPLLPRPPRASAHPPLAARNRPHNNAGRPLNCVPAAPPWRARRAPGAPAAGREPVPR